VSGVFEITVDSITIKDFLYFLFSPPTDKPERLMLTKI